MHRGWMSSEAFKPAPLSEKEAWIWLIENAAYNTKFINIKSFPVQIERGSLSYSVRYLSVAWMWDSHERVRRYLKHLETWGMIKCQIVAKQNLITLCSYDKYQSPQGASETGMCQPALQARDSNVSVNETNSNEPKERKETKQSLIDQVVLPQWVPVNELKAFIEFRQAIKKPVKTARALELVIDKLALLKREGHSPDAVLNQSILNGWQGLFPLTPERKAATYNHQHAEKKSYSQRMMEASVQAVINLQTKEGKPQ